MKTAKKKPPKVAKKPVKKKQRSRLSSEETFHSFETSSLSNQIDDIFEVWNRNDSPGMAIAVL